MKIEPVGLQDIKYIELYDKWRPLVPSTEWSKFHYYNIDPGTDRRSNVKKQTKAAREARAKRTRTKDSNEETQQSTQDDTQQSAPAVAVAAAAASISEPSSTGN